MAHQGKLRQNRAINEANTLALPDTYLFNCGLDPATIDWLALAPIVDRIFIRLMVDTAALNAQVTRLAEDGSVLASDDPNAHRQLPAFLIESGPYTKHPVVCLAMMGVLADPLAITAIAKSIQNDPSPFWKKNLDTQRPPFAPGDRDDRAAARLYQLLKEILKQF